MKINANRNPKYFLMIVAGIFFASVIAEIYLRIFNPQATAENLPKPYTFDCFRVGDYYYLKLAASTTCHLTSPIGAFKPLTFGTNSMGLRNRELVMPKPAGTVRILVIGDSMTMGWGIAEGGEYPRLVEKILRNKFPDKNIEVVNAGVAATGMTYDYLFMKYEMKKIDPDFVVIGFYPYTDVAFDIGNSRWVDSNNDGKPDKMYSLNTYIDSDGILRPKDLPVKYRFPLLKYSHLFAFLADRFFPTNYQKQFPDQRWSMPADVCLYKKDCHLLDNSVTRIEKLFLFMNNLARVNKVKYLVTQVPAEFSVYPNMTEKYGIEIPLLPWDTEYPTERFGKFFRDNGIDFLPLHDVFKQHVNEETYFLLDDHWNSRGHEIAAEAIAGRLTNLISGGDSSSSSGIN